MAESAHQGAHQTGGHRTRPPKAGWTRKSAVKEIDNLIQKAPHDGSLSHAQLWKGELAVWLQKNSLLCPITSLAEQLRSIGENLVPLNLIIIRDLGTGDPNFLNPAVLTQCVNLAKLAHEMILSDSEDSFADLPGVQVNTIESGDLASRMHAARKAVHDTQDSAAKVLGFSSYTWQRIETRNQVPDVTNAGLIEEYISRVKVIQTLRARGVLDFSDRARIAALMRDPKSLAALQSQSSGTG